jgi:hypothetical protein
MDFGHLIAGGGIIAVVTMVWGHIKSIYVKVSGVLLARARIEDRLAVDTLNYLFREWKRLPQTTVAYHSTNADLAGGYERATIPFKVYKTEGLNYRGRKFVLVKHRGNLSSRPGRIDTVIEMGSMSAENRRRMAEVTLRDWPHLILMAVNKGEGLTPVQFQETLIQIAFAEIARKDEPMRLAAE